MSILLKQGTTVIKGYYEVGLCSITGNELTAIHTDEPIKLENDLILNETADEITDDVFNYDYTMMDTENLVSIDQDSFAYIVNKKDVINQ